MKNVNLIMVTTDNNNKFYNMSENADNTFTVNYGRVGAKSQTETYGMSKWNQIYSQKIKKGYVDVTALKSTMTFTFKDVDNKFVAKLLSDLMKYSKQAVIDNYSVSSEQVSLAQIDEAQKILNQISELIKHTIDNKQIDDLLTTLYTTVPRKMRNVKDFIMNGTGDRAKAKRIVETEQSALDVMRGQVATQATSNDQTLEDALGVKVTKVTDSAVIENIKSMMGQESHRLVNVFEVTHPKSRTAFEVEKTKSEKSWTKLLWHGSRNENWLNILKTSLLIRPTCAVQTGAMFGNGIYFADKFRKSLGYTSLKGSIWANGSANQAFLSLFEVNTGMELRVEKHDSSYYSYDYNKLRSRGKFDSLFAKGGIDLKNNEYIIYNQNQCTIKYLVEIA